MLLRTIVKLVALYHTCAASKLYSGPKRKHFTRRIHTHHFITHITYLTAVGYKTLKEFIINSTGLSILSFRRNPVGATRSDWVDHFFGSKAFFTGINPRNVTSPVDDFKNRFKLPEHAKNPECSFELLGYMRFGDISPFTTSQFRNDLIIGEAPMTILQSEVPWTCLYRAAYDTWRLTPTLAIPIAFYCPVPKGTSCKELREMNKTISSNIVGHLKMEVENVTWTGEFSSALPPPDFEDEDDAYGNKVPTRHGRNRKRPTTCLVIPYESTEKHKKTVNGAMIYEWIRYYARLGFTVLVYDKNGANREAIYHSEYSAQRNKLGYQWFGNVFYHPYTVFGLLSNKSAHVTYDNSHYIPANVRTLLHLDDDKTATLTYCRFEANSLFGNDYVIVADFDEFLYCPAAASTLMGQRAYIHNLLHSYKQQNFAQLQMRQLWVPFKTFGGNYSTATDCLTHHITNRLSILDCYAGFRDNIGDFFYGKSAHLGHTCLVTNFHYSCNTGDCTCPTTGVSTSRSALGPDDACYYLHLSTNKIDFLKQNLSESTQKRFETEQSEISMIASNPIEHTFVGTHIY